MKNEQSLFYCNQMTPIKTLEPVEQPREGKEPSRLYCASNFTDIWFGETPDCNYEEDVDIITSPFHIGSLRTINNIPHKCVGINVVRVKDIPVSSYKDFGIIKSKETPGQFTRKESTATFSLIKLAFSDLALNSIGPHTPETFCLVAEWETV